MNFGKKGNNKTNKKTSIVASGIMVLIAAGMLVGGAVWAYNIDQFMTRAIHVEGEVVDMKSSRSDGTTTYAPVVLFELPQTDRSITFTHPVSSSHPSWETGDQLTVLYDPQNTHGPMIEDGLWNWLVPIILLILGVIFFIPFLLLLIKGIRIRFG